MLVLHNNRFLLHHKFTANSKPGDCHAQNRHASRNFVRWIFSGRKFGREHAKQCRLGSRI